MIDQLIQEKEREYEERRRQYSQGQRRDLIGNIADLKTIKQRAKELGVIFKTQEQVERAIGAIALESGLDSYLITLPKPQPGKQLELFP